MNIFEKVVKLVLLDLLDTWLVMPNFRALWEQPWSGIVTTTINCTKVQFDFFMDLV